MARPIDAIQQHAARTKEVDLAGAGDAQTAAMEQVHAFAEGHGAGGVDAQIAINGDFLIEGHVFGRGNGQAAEVVNACLANPGHARDEFNVATRTQSQRIGCTAAVTNDKISGAM